MPNLPKSYQKAVVRLIQEAVVDDPIRTLVLRLGCDYGVTEDDLVAILKQMPQVPEPARCRIHNAYRDMVNKRKRENDGQES